MSGARVKALEWVANNDEGPNLFGIVAEAKTSFPCDGDYIIYDEFAEENADGELEMTPMIDDETGGKFYFQGGEYLPTLEAAKAAAQADYEARILSALDLTAPPTPAEAMRCPEVRAMVGAAKAQLDYMEICGDAGDLERNLRAALAAMREVKK